MKNQGKTISRWMIVGYFVLLLLILGFIFLPSFGNPLRSDWWSALYAFHLVDASPGPPGFLFVINHDPWRDGTFRPVAHPILYLMHRLFAAEFFGYHLIAFSCYYLNVILLYLLGRRLEIKKSILFLFLFFFSVLFTHFDIITWTFHTSMLLSFSSFLSGLILFHRYLNGGNKLLLVLIGCLLLFSLLCLEIYLFWPLGMLLLVKKNNRVCRRPAGIMIGAIYCAYLLIFIITRTAPHTSGSISLPNIGDIFVGLCAVFFNLFYNGCLINFIPFVASPLQLAHNVEMSGPVSVWSPVFLRNVVITVGIISIIVSGLIAFIGRIRRRLPSVLGGLFFFYGAGFFVLAVGRITTENFNDLFLQFRYQYIANAFLVLIAALLVDRFCRKRTARKIICISVILAAALNIIVVRGSVNLLGKELGDQKLLLERISLGITKGEITPERPVSIPDGVISYLPELSWNRHMERFFRGTYQWVFSGEDIYCFTPFIRDAAWIVDGETLNYRPKTPIDTPVLPQRYIAAEYRARAGSVSTLESGGE